MHPKSQLGGAELTQNSHELNPKHWQILLLLRVPHFVAMVIVIPF